MTNEFDIVIAGGSIAGASLAGVLARDGWRVAVIERVATFRDRVRGEGIHPWGVAEAERLGLLPVLQAAGAHALPVWQSYTNRAPDQPYVWAEDSIGGHTEMSVYHPALQQTTLDWARDQGATVYRPAAAIAVRPGARPEVDIAAGDRTETLRARLVVGADGRHSRVRRWVGIATRCDRVHHLVGGGLLDRVALDPAAAHAGVFPGGRMFLLPQGQGRARAYVVISPQRFAEHQPQRFPEAFVALCASVLPVGALSDATIAGPIAFFPNADTWPAALTVPGVVLIGDAAGANDPSVGNGLSLVYRDVRVLRDALRSTANWDDAIAAYAECRQRDFAVLRAHAQWLGILTTEEGDEADARRERVARAWEADPSAGGFGLIFARGPDGLVADETARRHFFGQDLAIS